MIQGGAIGTGMALAFLMVGRPWTTAIVCGIAAAIAIALLLGLLLRIQGVGQRRSSGRD